MRRDRRELSLILDLIEDASKQSTPTPEDNEVSRLCATERARRLSLGLPAEPQPAKKNGTSKSGSPLASRYQLLAECRQNQKSRPDLAISTL
jgi:hypothetical protein